MVGEMMGGDGTLNGLRGMKSSRGMLKSGLILEPILTLSLSSQSTETVCLRSLH